MAEPIIGVFAFRKRLARQYFFSNGAITAMITKYETGN